MPGTLEHLEPEIISLTEERTGKHLHSYKPEIVCYGLRRYITSALKAILYYKINPSEHVKTEIAHELALLIMRIQVLASRLGIDLCQSIRFSFNDVAEQFRSERRMDV